jgi:hypothetical protein
MINSKLIILQTKDFSAENVFFNGQGVLGTVTAGSSSNVDLKILDDCFITGGILRTNGSNFGDYAHVQIVDIDNMLGYGANTVLRQFITNWYMRSDAQQQIETELSYPAKILAGLYIRIVYHSTGSTNVSVAMNYDLHKALY